MRLIDADAEREGFMEMVYEQLSDDPDNIRANLIIDYYDSLPTVELPARGEWIAKTKHQGGYIVSITCSVCGYAHSRVTHNFCPECGADMRKAGGNNV